MWLCVVWCKFTVVPQERTTAIYSVEEWAEQETCGLHIQKKKISLFY
jgi:hypothetical protein